LPRYELKFDPDALREWNKLDKSIKKGILPILERRLENPVIEGARLSGDLRNCFKIKSKNSGYRLIYTVQENILIVTVISVGKRQDLAAYERASVRIKRN